MPISYKEFNDRIRFELSRQSIWATLTLSSFVGIFSVLNLLKPQNIVQNSTVVGGINNISVLDNMVSITEYRILVVFLFLLISMLSYCALKLIWSYQIIRHYEYQTMKKSGIVDVFQNKVFNLNGRLKNWSFVVLSISMGLIISLLFLRLFWAIAYCI